MYEFLYTFTYKKKLEIIGYTQKTKRDFLARVSFHGLFFFFFSRKTPLVANLHFTCMRWTGRIRHAHRNARRLDRWIKMIGIANVERGFGLTRKEGMPAMARGIRKAPRRGMRVLCAQRCADCVNYSARFENKWGRRAMTNRGTFTSGPTELYAQWKSGRMRLARTPELSTLTTAKTGTELLTTWLSISERTGRNGEIPPAYKILARFFSVR